MAVSNDCVMLASACGDGAESVPCGAVERVPCRHPTDQAASLRPAVHRPCLGGIGRIVTPRAHREPTLEHPSTAPPGSSAAGADG